jgi:hypothetical protein
MDLRAHLLVVPRSNASSASAVAVSKSAAVGVSRPRRWDDAKARALAALLPLEDSSTRAGAGADEGGSTTAGLRLGWLR